MISANYPAASWFLWGVGVVFLLGAAAPLFFFPLRWGKFFGWALPNETAFTIYVGRCLGGVAIALSVITFRAASEPASHLESIEILLGSAAMLLIVHLWGAFRRSQPWQEDLELVMYLGIVGYGSYLYSQLPGALF